jgi:hypothetical protein
LYSGLSSIDGGGPGSFTYIAVTTGSPLKAGLFNPGVSIVVGSISITLGLSEGVLPV